jgi:hypothetical protein
MGHYFVIRSTTPLNFFTGVFGRWRNHARFLTFTAFQGHRGQTLKSGVNLAI